jgi:hypothetical protein
MNFPDRIFAVGGAGKAIALTLLESKWVLDELLRPRRNPKSLTVTIVDTAEGEKSADQQRVQKIRSRITDRESELRDTTKGRTGSITVEYKLITEDLHLSGSIDLLGSRAVPRITSGNGMEEEDWWLKEHHINENLDFAKGVVRKRGLGKAIYYKAYAEDDEISSYIDFPQKGKVAILAGLGGGTGSGIMMDLARHIQREQRTAEVTLFGVLPNHTEGRKESANAFAALSELEYNALSGDDLFKDRILVPIDPTNFDGKTGNRIKTDRFLQELDEGILYLILSYYNTEGLEDPFAGTPDYAPFTMGIPQVLRYNIEAITEAREDSREILKIKDTALEQEQEIHSKLETFLEDQYDLDASEQNTTLRNLDRTDLEERLEDIESVLEFDLFHELGYESRERFADIVSEGKASSGDITEQIDVISGSVNAVDITNRDSGAFVDDIDEYLADIIEQELKLLSQRKKILNHRQVIDDGQIREAIDYLLDSGDSNTTSGVTIQQLESKIQELQQQRDALSAELEEITSDLKTKREQRTDEVHERLSGWMEEIDWELQQLQELDTVVIKKKLKTLDARLDQVVYDITHAVDTAGLERIQSKEVRNLVADLRQVFESTNVGATATLDAITESLDGLKQAKRAFLTLHQQEKTIEKLTPWKSSTKEAHEKARRDYQIQKNDINEQGIFELEHETDEFRVTITYDSENIFELCREQEQALTEEVIDRLKTYIDEDLEQKEFTQLQAELKNRQPKTESVRAAGQEILQHSIGIATELEQRKKELESGLTEKKAELELYQTTVETVQDLNNSRETWTSQHDLFRNRLVEYEEETTESVSSGQDQPVYIKTIQPENIFRATGRDDIASSGLLNSDAEKQRIRSNLDRFAKNAQNQQYTGLYRRKIVKDRQRYDGLKVRVAVMSQAINDLDPEALDFHSTFQEAFDLGASGKRVESPYASWRQDAGGPWDIGLSVFITGVFLDNIRKIVQPDGYYAGYKQRAETLEEDIFIHHSYGLSKGQYVRRTDHLNLEADDEVQFFLRNGDKIAEDILEDFLVAEEPGQGLLTD